VSPFGARFADVRPRYAIGAALAVRILLIAGAWWCRGPAAFEVSDSWSYLNLAERLAAGKGFVDAAGNAELFRTPAYPWFLAIGCAVGHPLLFALASNLIMTAGIVALTFLIARQTLHDDRLARLCALVVALEPTLLTWSLKVMPETLLTLCLVAFVHAALRALDTRRTAWIVAAAIALCAAAYVKPIAYPLAILICLVSLPRIRLAAVFILACAVLLVPWHVRNERRAGYAGFSTLMARAAYLSAGGSVVARREHRPYEEVRQELLRRAARPGPDGDPARYGREGASLVASDPFGYALTHVQGMLRTLFDPGATEYLRLFGLYAEGGRATIAAGGVGAAARGYPLAFWSSAALALVLAPLVLLPFAGAFRARSVAFFLMALVAAYLVTAGGGVPGYSRFRAPAVPFLAILSAVAFRRPGSLDCVK
jgi:4-amino-4-deoxy-L-arabinose transferase-like glycosyltransferase